MAATIQTIQKPTRARALDTSNNNNHGQIYSGRALEFDGVSDYFQHNGGTNISGVNSFADGEAWTFATWIYFRDTKFTLFVGDDNSTHTNIGLHNSDYIMFRADSGNYYKFDSTQTNALPGSEPLQENTWYRLVITAKDNILTCYLNGVQHGSTITTSTNNTSNGTAFPGSASDFTGWGMPYATPRAHGLDGMMSDGQVWDSAWTADDASFDYLNPEQLALNRGGTLLTNSNLKIWYPMNDGHRGQQSYILDASNTGLGDEMVTNGDFSSGDLTGWTEGSTSNPDWQFDTVEYDNGRMHVVSNGVNEGAGYQTVNNLVNTPFVEGVTYRLAYDITVNSGSMAVLAMNGAVSNQVGYNVVHTSSENVVAYFTANSSAGSTPDKHCIEVYRSITTAGDIYIDNVSLKPVNDKNHATTVFYGDELITAQTNRDFSGSGNWAAFDPDSSSIATVVSLDSARMKIVTTTEASDEREGCELDMSYMTAPVAGRTYRISADMQATSAGFTLTVGMGGASTTQAITTSDATYNMDITVANSVGTLRFYTTENTARTWHMDNISVKEVGTATGWTDADQQLDIPQTALQSYNQLAWFDGYATDTAAELDSTFYFEVGQTINMWVFPNSITIYDSIFGARETENYVRYQKNSGSFVSTNELVQFEPENNTAYSITATISGILEVGKWQMYTFIWNTDRTIDFYVNGLKIGESSATADTTDGKRLKVGHFGAGYGTSSLPFEGAMTEISYWNAGFNLSEVTQLYNNGKALDATLHTKYSEGAANLTGYWRNNGLSEWKDLKGSNDANVDSTETMLITAGVDGLRDSQGFIMNRQRATNSLNLCVLGSVDTGNYVSIPVKEYDIDGSPTSFSFWFKYEGVGNGAGQSILGSSTTSSASMLQVNPTNKITIEGDTNNKYARNDDSYTALTLGEWYHFAITCAGDGSVILYKNGASLGTTEYGTGSDIDVNMTIDQIGLSSTGSYEVDSQIDDLAIYEGKALTAAEVKRNYNAGKRSHK